MAENSTIVALAREGDIAGTACINSAQPNVTQAREICKIA